MKSTGIVRKIDELGRIVLPKEIRKVFDLKEKDPVEIYTDEDKIVLVKYHPSCIFCGDADDVIFFGGKRVCRSCIEKLKDQL
ncbi:MAG: AbrB/MazE/SpoVT family DNA-binding domain-containing protein [Clostridia bacterium]|nr:AbrB/MazE/SpoVT family DNA-binding domain-containing protein [Clostridia bacterium]